jgi:uncharacterized membrane protein HdeD (DUF308 family)
MMYGYYTKTKKARRKEMLKLMYRSVGMGLITIGIGHVLVFNPTPAGIIIITVGLLLCITDREATNG